MKGGFYRPAYLHTLKAGLDANGAIVGWQHRIVGQSILAGTPFEAMMVKTASTRPASKARPRCPMRSRTSPSTCIRRRWAFRCCGGARSADAHRLRDRGVHRRTCRRGGQGPGRLASRCSTSTRATRRCSNSRPRPTGQAEAGKPGESAGGGVACTNRSVRTSRRSRRYGRQGRSLRSTPCARGRLRTPSTPTTSAQMKAVSASDFGRALRRDHVQGRRRRAGEFPRLSGAAHHEMPAVEVHIVPRRRSPPGSANLCRRSRPPSPMRWPMRPASACVPCR